MVARPLDIVTVCPAFSGNPLTSPVPAAPTIAARLRYPSTDKSTKQWSTLSELATTLIHPFFWGVKDVVPIFMSVTVPPIVGAKLLLLRLYPFINIHYYFQRCSNLAENLGKLISFSSETSYTSSAEMMNYIQNTAPIGYSVLYNNANNTISTCYTYKASNNTLHVMRITTNGQSSLDAALHWCSGGAWNSKRITPT